MQFGQPTTANLLFPHTRLSCFLKLLKDRLHYRDNTDNAQLPFFTQKKSHCFVRELKWKCYEV